MPAPCCTINLLGTCVFYSGSDITAPGIIMYDNMDVVVNKLATYTSTALFGANNGMSVATGNIAVLGQDTGASGDPAKLNNNRELPMNNKVMTFKGGKVVIDSDHQVDLSNALFKVNNSGSQFFELARFSAPIAEVSVLTPNATTGFCSMLFYAGSGATAFKLSVGYDGPANHVFMADVRNCASATWEINGSPIGGFITATGDYWFGNTPTFTDEARVHIFSKGTGQTASFKALKTCTTASTFNTTSAALNSYAGHFISDSTRSSGANDLTNIGIYSSASGAQVNYAAIFDAGQVGIGTTTPSSGAKLHVDGGTAHFGAGTVSPSIVSISAGDTSTASLNIGTTASLKTTPADGDIEFDGTNLYITIGGTRKTFTVV